MRLPKIVAIILQLFIGVTILFVASILLADYFDIYPTVKPYVVMSGSMEPAIKLGSVVVVRPQLSYSSGDVITYSQDGNQDQPITHRVVFRQFPQGLGSGPEYLTAGDANEDFDRVPVKTEHIIGQVVFSIPYLGYAVDFAKRPYGFILLVIVPATIVIYEEIKTVFKELFKLLKRAKTKIKKSTSKTNQNTGKLNLTKGQKRQFPKAASVIPIMGALLVFASLTGSFFSDHEETVGNVFEAASTFAEESESIPTPTPTTPEENIVINEVYYFVHNDDKIANSESASEWAELYNPTNSAISLAGWSVEDNTSCDNIPGSLSIPSNGFAILSVVTEAEFEAIWTSVPDDVIFIQSPTAIGNGLANSDELMLQSGICDSGGDIIDHISWGSNTDGLNPSIPMTGRGHSSEREPDGTDTDTNSDFIEQDPPTPGT